jgi:hypothetical protein
MSSISFEADPLPGRVARFFLLLQLAGMAAVVGLCILNHYFLALTISLLTLFAFLAVLLWLYSRYRELPLVREKRELERLLAKFQKGIQSETRLIQAAIRQREVLFQAEKDEIQKALQALQRNHMEDGLAAAQIGEATIPGIGPKLKERLATYGVTNAANVTEKIAQLPGFGEAKHQALMNWRASVRAELESTRPHALPHEQLEVLKQKYQALQDRNDAGERKARGSKQILDHELTSFQPRIQHLAPLTFLNYLSQSLASRGVVAGLLAILLIVSQVVSSVSALTSTAASLLASIPLTGATPVPTETLTQIPTVTRTHAPTATLTKTFTASPTSATNTSTATVQASQTNLPAFTSTLAATLTPLPVLQPTDTPEIPVSGNCDPAYPGVCIPPAPPDLDCADVPYRNFQVLSPDPHNFDRDADGLGCEN